MSEGNGYVSLEALTTPRARPEKDVEVEGLGKVRLRGFSVRQRSAFERSVQGKNLSEIRERLIVATVIKPEGLTAAHVKLLGDQDASLLEPLVDEAMVLTGIKKQDMESLTKNSEATTESDSTSS